MKTAIPKRTVDIEGSVTHYWKYVFPLIMFTGENKQNPQAQKTHQNFMKKH